MSIQFGRERQRPVQRDLESGIRRGELSVADGQSNAPAQAFEQNAVSRAVWRWQGPGASPPPGTTGPAIKHAAISAVVAATFFLLKWHWMAGLAAAGGGVLLLSGLTAPSVFRGILTGLAFIARAAGFVLTWLLLVPFFFLCFVPGRLILRLRGVDPMRRELTRDQETYWDTYAKKRPAAHYTKQY